MSRRRGRGRRSSAGRLAHPPYSMRVVEACSTAAARRAAFDRPHCRPRITEVHSAVACCKDRWTKRGGELGLFQFLKQSIATLTYAMLVGHQFTNRITKLLTQAKRDKTK